MKTFTRVICLAATALLSGQLLAQTPQLSLVPFGSGFTRPVSIAHANDSRLFVVEQAGRIFILTDQGVRLPTAFLDISSRVGSSGNEQGLLGLAFHPGYASNGFFFVNYTNLQGHTVIARFQVTANTDSADAASEQIVLTVQQPFSNHNGGNIIFGPDGYLYIGMGDGGSAGDPNNNGQNPQSLLGKMLRINVDAVPYTVPASNPFVSNAAVMDEIWSIGLRNPWRWSFDRHTGDMWIGDVGQNAWEEINFEPAGTGGLNYGWRCYEANAPYSTGGCQPQSAYTFPVSTYANSASTGCSVTGGFVYRGGLFGRLYGHYLYTDYCSGRFRSVVPDGTGGYTTTQLITGLTFQYTAFGEDQTGELYIAGRGNGNIYKIQETSCLPTAVILGDSVRPNCTGLELHAVPGAGNTYQWYENGQQIPGATAASFTPTNTGTFYVIVTNAASCSDTSATVQVLPFVFVPSIQGLVSQYTTADPSVTLTGNPPNGTFSGPGIIGNTFTPSVAGVGTHTITYSFTDPCGIADVISVQVTVTLQVGLPEQAEVRNLALFPNPASSSITAGFTLQQAGMVAAEVLNNLGQVVYRQQQYLEQGEQQVSLKLPLMASGIYQLRLQHPSGVAVSGFAVE